MYIWNWVFYVKVSTNIDISCFLESTLDLFFKFNHQEENLTFATTSSICFQLQFVIGNDKLNWNFFCI
jgi:hypothetical protein